MITMVLGIFVIAALVASALAAASLIRLTRFRSVWTAISASALIAAAASGLLLADSPPGVLSAVLFLLAALLLFAGLLGVRPMCTAFQASMDRLSTARAQLADTRRTLEDVLRKAPLIVFATDRDGVFTLSEGHGLEALGLSPGEAVGRSAFEMYKDHPQILSNLRNALAGEEIAVTVDLVDRSYEAYYSPIRGPRGTVNGVFGVSIDVSRSKHTEAQLRATKERFRSLLETTSDWAWEFDSDAVYTYSSPRIRDLLGFEPDELIGKTPFDTMTPDVAEVVRDVYEGFFARRIPFNGLVNTCLHKDGHEVVVESSGVPIFDDETNLIGYRGIDRDITARTEAERALRAEKETAQMYLDIAGVIMVALDRNRKVTRINAKGCEILGYDEAEILGKDWFEEFLPEASRGPVRDGFNGMMRGELEPMAYNENPVVTRTGEERLIAWHNTLIHNDAGEIAGTLSSGSDVTDRRREERERQELEAQLQHSQRLETIGTLAGGIAHDFNNILFPILGYTDLAMEDIGPDHPTYRNLEQVTKAAHRARELVEQIMVFSRQVDREVGPIHPHLIVREALKFIRASLPTTIEIQQSIHIEAGVIEANTAQIHHMLVNLCTNAAHSMRDTGGVLRVELQPFEVDADAAGRYADLTPGSWVRLSVSDTGPGMDEQTKKRMFEPFFTTREVGEGTGLGLSVVHGIVAGHGGVISVDSAPEQGTTVTVFFPRAERPPGADQDDGGASATGTEYVLFVDDETDIVNLGRHMLERLGYRVTTASNGDAALELLRSQPRAFDVLVTDQTMPGITGLELIREAREIRPDLPAILLTGFSEKVTPEVLSDTNVDGYLLKPLVARNIGAAIRRALDS